jgi:2-polyprenyl-3-methyl-5-hydroxy-6-metoxy-1,4-benzoquinol methylase
VTVNADFEAKYRRSADPWDALHPKRASYYDWYCKIVDRYLDGPTKSLLDIGCGEGHLTHRLASGASEAMGVDVSATAIRRATERYQTIAFRAFDLTQDVSLECEFDVISCSQVLYYLTPEQLWSFGRNIYRVLRDGGAIAIAANCSGGDYFDPDEFLGICSALFEEVETSAFEHHRLFVGRKRACSAAITVDYEVSEHGERLLLDPSRWQREVIAPTAALLDAVEQTGAKLTIFAEMGQYRFLKRYLPETAASMEQQWREAIGRGHDIQVHLHTRWLPEGGATVVNGNQIVLSSGGARLHALSPRLLKSTLEWAKTHLEAILQPIDPSYSAICFRAGKYQIQPHDSIFAILRELGYRLDSSVWHGGFLSAYDSLPGFDFRTLWTTSRPYRPNSTDINRPASGANGDVIELPILAEDRRQWSFDIMDAAELTGFFERHRAGGGSRVMIGHSKCFGERQATALTAGLSACARYATQWVTLRGLAHQLDEDWPAIQRANESLASYMRRSLASPEQLYEAMAPYHQRKAGMLADDVIALARCRPGKKIRILDAGCGTGELLTFPLYHLLSGAVDFEITAIDPDQRSIDRAKERAVAHGLTPLHFATTTADALTEPFDVVVCSEVLEHLESPAALVSSLADRVDHDGLLVLTTPNGFGYKEIERRILTLAFKLAERSPRFITSALRKIARRLRQRASTRKAPYAGGSTGTVIGTLNFENDIHIQFFTTAALRKMLRQAGCSNVTIRNTQPLGGIAGTWLDRRLKLFSNVHRWPSWLAAGWYISARTSRDQNKRA